MKYGGLGYAARASFAPCHRQARRDLEAELEAPRSGEGPGGVRDVGIMEDTGRAPWPSFASWRSQVRIGAITTAHALNRTRDLRIMSSAL